MTAAKSLTPIMPIMETEVVPPDIPQASACDPWHARSHLLRLRQRLRLRTRREPPGMKQQHHIGVLVLTMLLSVQETFASGTSRSDNAMALMIMSLTESL